MEIPSFFLRLLAFILEFVRIFSNFFGISKIFFTLVLKNSKKIVFVKKITCHRKNMDSATLSLCQSSIHNFISSIPSEASELAINVVNNLIEDQVADPKKFERNINRVKSIFSRRRRPRPLFYGLQGATRGDGGGDCPYSEIKLLLTLPRKVRQNIWRFLDNKSVKTLRMVSRQLKHEMDFDVGLPIVLTTKSFSDPWIKSISIRSCTVIEIDTLLQFNHLAKPEKLEKMCFAPEIDIDARMIELIIRKFRNLRQLTIFTDDIAELTDFGREAVSKGTSSEMMTRLEEQFQLTSVDVKFDTSKWKLKWNIKLKPQILDKYWEVQNVVGPFGLSGIAKVPRGRDLSKKSLRTVTLSIPFVQDEDRFTWLRVLQAQNALSSLTCDLNATHWKEYEKIIQANCQTLQKLFILNITCTPNEFWNTELAFDWKMFEDCQGLEEITLIADTFMRSSDTTCSSSTPRRYFESLNISSLQNCPLLRAIWMENFKLTKVDMEFLNRSSDSEEDSLKNARFEQCTLRNCMVDNEKVTEIHVGRKKRRNRSLECLCFGTTCYDDDDLNNFEKYKATGHSDSLLGKSNSDIALVDWDMIDYFQNSSGMVEQQETEHSDGVLNNVNFLMGVALTAWLYWS